MRYVREFIFYRLILFLIGVILVSGIGVCATYGGPMTWVAIVSGIVAFGIIEYIVHRFILHEFPRLFPHLHKGHVAHHQHPNDTEHLFGPVRYDLFGYILLYAVLWAITRSIHLASAVVLGISACQLYYQWKHFVSHRPIVPVTPWGKWMKKAHLLHHYKDPNYWYGVSNPIMDMIMGTNMDKQHAKKAAHVTRDV